MEFKKGIYFHRVAYNKSLTASGNSYQVTSYIAHRDGYMFRILLARFGGDYCSLEIINGNTIMHPVIHNKTFSGPHNLDAAIQYSKDFKFPGADIKSI